MWHGILGHDEVVDQFRRTVQCGRLASTYLFVGPAGIGKRRFALELAKALLCCKEDGSDLEPCERCESCRLLAIGNHPDLEVVGLPPDKSALPIAMFIGDDQHRNQEGLCHRIALRPYVGRRKVAIIDDADHFSQSSANCLLKTLEEPPAHSLLILIGTSPARQLPTIRSRSQIVRFRPLTTDLVAQILLDAGIVPDREQAANLAKFSDGSVERAVQLADPALWQFRELLLGELAAAAPDGVRFARAVQAFVDEAGTESSLRRDRLRMVIGFAVDFYRVLLPRDTQGSNEADLSLQRAQAQFSASRHLGDPEPTLQALDACLATVEYVDRNANLGLAIQEWCENLADLTGKTALVR